jgi:hypothetical protein
MTPFSKDGEILPPFLWCCANSHQRVSGKLSSVAHSLCVLGEVSFRLGPGKRKCQAFSLWRCGVESLLMVHLCPAEWLAWSTEARSIFWFKMWLWRASVLWSVNESCKNDQLGSQVILGCGGKLVGSLDICPKTCQGSVRGQFGPGLFNEEALCTQHRALIAVKASHDQCHGPALRVHTGSQDLPTILLVMTGLPLIKCTQGTHSCNPPNSSRLILDF